jgi:hypothetical protein
VRVDGRREHRKYPNPATQQEHRFTEIVWRERVFLGGPIESGLGAPGSSLRGAEPPPDAAESI